MELREVEEGDLPTFYEHQRDPEASRMAAFVPRERAAFFEHWHTKILGDPAVLARTIIHEGRVVGYVASFTREGQRLACYWIGRECWGLGLASEALIAFVKRVDLERPLDAMVATANVGSIRVLEKGGFEAMPNSCVLGGDGVEEVCFRLR